MEPGWCILRENPWGRRGWQRTLGPSTGTTSPPSGCGGERTITPDTMSDAPSPPSRAPSSYARGLWISRRNQLWKTPSETTFSPYHWSTTPRRSHGPTRLVPRGLPEDHRTRRWRLGQSLRERRLTKALQALRSDFLPGLVPDVRENLHRNHGPERSEGGPGNHLVTGERLRRRSQRLSRSSPS